MTLVKIKPTLVLTSLNTLQTRESVRKNFKNLKIESREMAQWSRVLDALPEDLSFSSRPHMAAYNHHSSSSRGPNTVFWPS